ncbi:MAG: pantoate--beta-alanine ligase [Candidatus Korobacteraceae bacterium]|jgi:pantoate--beta-alanine ligase
MRIFEQVSAMQQACRELRQTGTTLGFVPTMGALHAGHLSLVRAARAQCGAVAASIFVNPLQFGPKEDLARYPRSFEQDCRLLVSEGVDLLFAPTVEQMYPPGAVTVVHVEGLSEKLDGKSRPGHFRGVTTVVAKLFEIVRPQFAYFGQKDAAQLAVLRKMVRDLNIDVEIVACPTIREADGIAMSSRNVYLSPDERQQALCLFRALSRVQSLAAAGEHDAGKLICAARQIIAAEMAAEVDYAEIVDPDTLDPVNDLKRGALVAIACTIGKTRLIDNILLPAIKAHSLSEEAQRPGTMPGRVPDAAWHPDAHRRYCWR